MHRRQLATATLQGRPGEARGGGLVPGEMPKVSGAWIRECLAMAHGGREGGPWGCGGPGAAAQLCPQMLRPAEPQVELGTAKPPGQALRPARNAQEGRGQERPLHQPQGQGRSLVVQGSAQDSPPRLIPRAFLHPDF